LRLSIRLLLLLLIAPLVAHSQALPTATQLFQLSAFGGATGTWTGLPAPYTPNGAQGRNMGITAGVNLSLPYLGRFIPSVEVRGTYPVEKGGIDAQESAYVGGKVERRFGRYRPYGDFFYGRGRIDYQGAGYPSPDGRFIYLYTNSAVYSPGGGVDIDLTPHFATKFDFQYQHFGTPAVAANHVYAKAATVAVIYRFNFNHQFKYTRDGMVRERTSSAPARRPAPQTAPVVTPQANAPAPNANPAPAPDAASPVAPAAPVAPATTPTPPGF
jgi:hypothetical protein